MKAGAPPVQELTLPLASLLAARGLRAAGVEDEEPVAVCLEECIAEALEQ